MKSFKESYAVTGYATDEVARGLSGEQADTIEISPERGVQDVVMRVHRRDVTEVRTGSSSGGHTVVQLLLRDGAVVETVTRTRATHEGITRFHDPALQRVIATATAKVIEA